MSAREPKIKKEDKASAADYLKKASDNYDQMLVGFHASNWNAAATLAVQCAISSADAVCVYEKGIRSVSQDHVDVCGLVAQLPLEGAGEKGKQLRKIIARKNMVQYEWRVVAYDQWKKVDAEFDFKPEALTGIILGVNIKEGDERIVKDILQKRNMKVLLYKAKLHEKRYALEILPLE